MASAVRSFTRCLQRVQSQLTRAATLRQQQERYVTTSSASSDQSVRHVSTQFVPSTESVEQTNIDVEPGYDELPVYSYNEWDTLEEIIVGRAEGQRIPELSLDLMVS